MTSEVTSELADGKSLLKRLRALLCYHRQVGMEGYPKTASGEEFLRRPLPVVEGVAVADAPGLEEGAAMMATGQGGVVAPPSLVRLADIAEEVRSCQACELCRQRLYPVPGLGPDNMRVFVVGHWLMADQQGVLPPGRLFGVEQDAMLSRMFSAIKLSPGEIFITNVVKCALPAGGDPQEGQITCCRSYLLRQLSAATPELVVTMGSVATRAVLGESANFTRVRGKIQYCEGVTGRRLPVLATYHPSYLLQNPEMKQAAWTDLQLLARHFRLDRR
jgi:uracil-DNA glycosylase